MTDLAELGRKLCGVRDQLTLSLEEAAALTGLAPSTIDDIERGKLTPSGDQLLIFADIYRCDYKYFLSNEKLTAFEQTDILYRKFGSEFVADDRRAVLDLLFLCETEAYLQEALGRTTQPFPPFIPRGGFFKRHGWEAAEHVRRILGFGAREVSADPFRDFRRLGIHVFRRRLANSNISGLFLNHPIAGRCIIVNYDEDVYRQRFTVAHEAGHAIIDAASNDPSVSFYRGRTDNVEYRANAFAAAYLVPPDSIRDIHLADLSDDSFLGICKRLSVNAQPLAYAFKEFNGADTDLVDRFAKLRVPRPDKPDPELGSDLTPASRERRQELLERGLSYPFIRLCFDAHREGIISLLRLSEVLLLDIQELLSLMKTFGEVPIAG